MLSLVVHGMLAMATPPNASAAPSVCITIPTNGRPEFLEHALGMIRRQEYSGKIVRRPASIPRRTFAEPEADRRDTRVRRKWSWWTTRRRSFR
jgi:hypothetical protein